MFRLNMSANIKFVGTHLTTKTTMPAIGLGVFETITVNIFVKIFMIQMNWMT